MRSLLALAINAHVGGDGGAPTFVGITTRP